MKRWGSTGTRQEPDKQTTTPCLEFNEPRRWLGPLRYGKPTQSTRWALLSAKQFFLPDFWSLPELPEPRHLSVISNSQHRCLIGQNFWRRFRPMHERLHCITSSSSSTCCLRVPRFLASFSRFALLPSMFCKSVRFYATAALRTCLWTNLVHNFLDTFACQRVVVCCMLCKSVRLHATAALRTCLWTNLEIP